MLKKEWGAESNGTLSHLFISRKTAALVPEFAVEDLPSAELHSLVPCACSEGPSTGQNTVMMMIYRDSLATPQHSHHR